MNLDLCKGIVVVIDDKALPKPSEPKDLIVKIIEKIKANNIPLCIYADLAQAQKAIPNFNSVNFLILDWDMQGELNFEDAANIIKPSQANRVMKFINEFKKVCFCPIFIFSNAGVGDIQNSLQKQNLFFDDNNKNFILIRSKKDLIKGKKLFSVIENWISENPTNYTLKNWENSFSQAKTETFQHLFSKSPVWPKVMWESFTDDSVDPESSLNEIIFRLIKSRSSLTKLDSKKINRRKFPLNNTEIKDVIQGIMFVDIKYIPKNEIRPGDIFSRGGGRYYLNIRPECDTIVDRVDKSGKKSFDGKVYLIKGERVSVKEFRNHFDPKVGIKSRHDHVLIFGIEGRDFVKFNFKELVIDDFDKLKTTRICRLISPYINNVQQQYSSYIGRFGIPRIPTKVLKSIK
jgi:hypothetical protein